MPREFRLALAAFASDMGLYLLMLAVAWRASDLGAGALLMGSIPLLYSGPYSALALVAGGRSDHGPRHRRIRAGALVAAGGALLVARAASLPLVMLSVPVLGLGLANFWPSLQAAFSELRGGRDLGRLMGWFNVGWSSGKATGFLAGGALVAGLGAAPTSVVAALCFAGAAAAVPGLPLPGDHSEAVAADPRRPPAHRQQRFLWSARLANALGFGLAALLTVHLPAQMRAEGTGAQLMGGFLGLVFVAQALGFLWLRAHAGWRYRALPLLLSLLLAGALAAVAPWLAGGRALLVLAPPLGVALGFCYLSSIYYAVDAPGARGRRAGAHEASLGIASALLPLLAGAAGALGDSPTLPFLCGGAVALLAAALAGHWLRPGGETDGS